MVNRLKSRSASWPIPDFQILMSELKYHSSRVSTFSLSIHEAGFVLGFCRNEVVYGATGRSVTANMPALGAGDSGFESRRPD